MLAAGDHAPSFSLIDTTGEACALADLAQGPVLLAFYKAGCPVCQMTLPYLERIGQGELRVVAISQDDPALTGRFQKMFGITLRTLLDREEDRYAVSNAYGITNVPSLFLIETEGNISFAGAGFRKSEIEELGARAGVAPFRHDENVPAWKAG